MELKTANDSKTTSRASLAKRRIMDTAVELFAERGYGNVGINEVGITAGFGKGALYYHIRSKEDLLISIISEHMERLIAAAHRAVQGSSGTAARVDALIGSFVDELLSNRPAMTVCYRDVHAIVASDNLAIVNDLHGAYRTIWADIFADGATANEHREIQSAEIDAFLGMLFSSVFWIEPGVHGADKTLTRTFTRTVLSAVFAPSEPSAD